MMNSCPVFGAQIIKLQFCTRVSFAILDNPWPRRLVTEGYKWSSDPHWSAVRRRVRRQGIIDTEMRDVLPVSLHFSFLRYTLRVCPLRPLSARSGARPSLSAPLVLSHSQSPSPAANNTLADRKAFIQKILWNTWRHDFYNSEECFITKSVLWAVMKHHGMCQCWAE